MLTPHAPPPNTQVRAVPDYSLASLNMATATSSSFHPAPQVLETELRGDARTRPSVAEAFAALHGAGEVNGKVAGQATSSADPERAEPEQVHIVSTDPTKRMPHLPSFCVVLSYSMLTVTSFTIVLPTSRAYTASFGAPAALVGALVGLNPFFSGLAQPFLVPVFKKLRLKTVLLAFCVVNVLASTLYALGALSDTVTTVLIARCLMGTVGGPAVCSTFVVRSTGVKVRSIAMQRVGVGIGLGYAIGPFLGVLVETVCQAAGWTHRSLNSNTAPGWVMAALFVIEMALIANIFVEPKGGGGPPPKGSGGDASPSPVLPRARIAVGYLVVYLAPINVGLWDVNTVFRATTHWRWSIEHAGARSPRLPAHCHSAHARSPVAVRRACWLCGTRCARSLPHARFAAACACPFVHVHPHSYSQCFRLPPP